MRFETYVWVWIIQNRSNDINEDIDDQIENFKKESQHENFPDKYIKKSKNDYIKESANDFTNQLDSLIDDEILNIVYVCP